MNRAGAKPGLEFPSASGRCLDREIRCLLSGKNRSAFRIAYQFEGDEVRVLAIRRPSQDLMEPGDVSG